MTDTLQELESRFETLNFNSKLELEKLNQEYDELSTKIEENFMARRKICEAINTLATEIKTLRSSLKH